MTIKLGLVGTGTVGGGCIDILQKHKEDFKRHYGIDVELARVCSRDPKQAEAHGVSDLFTLDYHDIVNDPDIDIVVELIGGAHPATEIYLDAFAHGKQSSLIHLDISRRQLDDMAFACSLVRLLTVNLDSGIRRR